MEQAALRTCGSSNPERVQSLVRWGLEQPLIEVVSAYGRGLRLGDLQGPVPPKIFYGKPHRDVIRKGRKEYPGRMRQRGLGIEYSRWQK